MSVADGWVHELPQGLTNLQQIRSPFISFVSIQRKCGVFLNYLVF